MLNLVFLKKILFTTTITCSTALPVYLIYKRQGGSDEVISELKKHIDHFSNGSYTENVTLNKFAKYLLKSEIMEKQIATIAVKELIFEWLKKENSSQYKKILKDEEERYKTLVADEKVRSSLNIEQKVFDNHGGTRNIMRKRYISDKGYEDLKKELTNFDSSNFTMNQKNMNGSDTNGSNDWASSKDKYFIPEQHYLSENELNNTGNWSKISWYPIYSDKLKSDLKLQELEIKKFNLINYAYKLWFSETQPFHVHTALWKYDSQGDKMKDIYTDKKIKKLLPEKPNYSFPVFSKEKEKKQISKLEKFKEFTKKISSGSWEKDDIFYLPLDFTDDNSTLLYVEGKNMYKELFTEFAAASNHIYAKIFDEKDKTCFWDSTSQAKESPQKSKTSSNINEIDTSSLKSKKLDNLFLEAQKKGKGSKGSSSIKRGIQISNEVNSGQKIAYDAREVKDKNWILIRNEAGIHAIKVDGIEYINKNGQKQPQSNGNGCKLKKAYEFFNFRFLQSLKKENLKINKAASGGGTQELNSFKKFIENNFEQIIVKYWLEDNSSNYNLFKDIKIENHEKIKDLITKNQRILKYKEKISDIDTLRTKILEKYANRKYVLDGSKKLKNSDKQEGLSAPLPYEIDLSLTEDKLFPSLEKIYDLRKPDSEELKEEEKKLEKEKEKNKGKLEELYKKYNQDVDSYIESIKLGINTEYSFFNSDRLFTNSYLIDQWTDLFLKDADALNQYILDTYFVNDYLKRTKLKKKFKVENDYFISLKNKPPKKTKAKRTKRSEPQKKEEENNGWFSKKLEEGGEGEDIFDNLSQFLKLYYYKHTYLPKNNFWELLKNGNWEKKEKKAKQNNTTKNIKKKLEKYFKEQYFLNFHKNREEYQKFLITLIFLTKNNFENFRELMKKLISDDNKTFLVWRKAEIKKGNFKLENIFNNPWIKSEDGTQQGKKQDIKYEQDGHLEKLKAVLSTQYPEQEKPKDKGKKGKKKRSADENQYIFQDLITISEDSENTWDNWVKLEKLPKKIFKYGSRDELITIIEKIGNTQELTKLLKHLKENIPSLDLKAVESENIYIAQSSSSSNQKQLRNITLEEKKNALLALVYNYKMPKEQKLKTGISKEEYKKIYLLDPDNGFQLSENTQRKLQTKQIQEEKKNRKKRNTKAKKNQDYAENIKENVFERFKKLFGKNENKEEKGKKKAKEKEDKYFLIQIKNCDWNTKEQFRKFINDNLNEEIFWEWILNSSTRKEIQEEALEKLESNIGKSHIFDSKWKNNLKEKYVKD